MNRLSYRLVFNRSLGALVAVAECTRGRGKSPSASGARGATATAALLGGVLMASPAWAETPIPGVDARGNFATFGQAGTQLNGNQLLVNQVGNKSILNWQKFNISAGAGVQFRQVNNLTDNQLVNGASFTSLNRIWDINPSVIAGSITQGAGQKANIILVNSNGIAFMGGSQVNLNSFTATTLNMADRYVTDRLLGDPTSPQFAGALDGSEARGFIKVFEGAKITADSQGRVMLIAPTVINRGNISAPDGQVILAAGTKAYLRTDDTNNNLETRGLLIEVDSSSGLEDFVTPNTGVTDGELDGQTVSLREPASDLLGHATNVGTLSAARGNVTMVGYAVNQNGIARATSSVVANGSVYLMAKDTYTDVSGSGDYRSTRFGQVIMGEGSLTEVLPETQDATTSVDGTTGSGQAAPSEVRAIGRQIHMADGSTIRVPSGEVSLTATTVATAALGGLVQGTLDATARVQLEQGSTIDVSGLVGVDVSAGRNNVQVELRGDELKDSPINQTGPLRGKTAWVDIQQALDNAEAGVDTLIAKDSLQAYGARLERTIAERSTAGGKVVIDSTGSVVVDNGATINLSGGSVDYQQATVKTMVLSSAGKLVDLADAVASTRYDAIASQYTIDYGRWNKTETIELPNAQRVVRGYTDGQDAGSLSVFAQGDVYLRPNVVGSTIAGERQLAGGKLPRGAQVYLGGDASGSGVQGGNALNTHVVIDRSTVGLPAGFAPGSELPESLQGTTTIDADLLAQGRVAELSVITSQAADVRAALRAPTGGKLSITATDIAVQSDIVAAGGTINLAAKGNPGSGSSVHVADGVTLSTAGTWVNRLTDPAGASIAPVLDGGDITITASSSVEAGSYLGQGTVSLGQGVRLDASGGALLDEKGQVKGGEGGHITVKGYEVSGLSSASLSAYGLEEGGELTLSARNITIGGTSPADPATGDLHLDAGFFTQGGFADYALQALENLTVADKTVVQPVVAHRNLNADVRLQASGARLADISTSAVRDPLVREGADISLTALERATDTGDLRIGEGARIEVDPGASITLTGRKSLSIEGDLVAHGGDVTATLLARSPNGFNNGSTQGNLYLGDNATIDVSGVAMTGRDSNGLLQGEVLAGGSVKLLASPGALITRSGSSIDVSGAGPVTLGERNETGGLGRVVASDAGSLSLRGQSLYLDGALKGQAGSATQSGGSLVIGSSGDTSEPNNSNLLSNTVLDLELHNQLAAQAVGLTAQTDLNGVSDLRVATDPLEQAGFDRLRFNSSDGVVLADGLDLGRAELRELQLDAARIVALGDAHLSADAVRLGNYQEGTTVATLRVGSAGDISNHGGTLTAQARLLELAGNLRLQGMERSDLTGTELLQLSGVNNREVTFAGSAAGVTGDQRHSAQIQSTGDLTLRGGVVAPGGFSDVQIRATGRDVRIESAGTTPIVPLSALGRLSIEAQNITQAGYLVAPFGQISLNATGDLTLEAGSVTSVAGVPGQVLPVGQLLNGIEWRVNLDPTDTNGGQTTLNELPGKELRLSGGNITMAAASDGRSAATVNVSGGGDLQAYEFTAGPGGSRDILTDANTYAIIPGYQSGFAPDDAQESTGLAVGTALYLQGVRGLADGKYVLLPAHYALLPGAMAVRLNGDAAPLAGRNQTRQDGIQVAAGYLTDSRSNATRSGDWVGVQVLTQEQVKARSEFTVARASSFFAGTGSAPQDAGLLSLSTQDELVLGASIRGAAASGGQGMAVDISAPNLLITSGDTTEAAPGTTALSVDQLTGLGARSLLLGATREKTGDGTELTVAASTVTLDNDASHALAASEVMLAARDAVTLGSGSLIDAQGAGGDAGAYTTEGNGAFVRAASTSATFTRSGAPDRSTGVVTGASDAVVQAAKSITVDATQANDFAGQTVFSANGQAVAGELAIGATRISFGQPAERPEGLTLDPDALAALQGVKALTLTSYSSFDLYDGAEVGGVDANGVPLLGKLTLEGGGLTGLENEGMSASLRARELTLNNTAGVGASLPPTQQTLGSGTLDIVADKLTLGAGDKTIDGFSVVNIRAAEVAGADTGRTTVNAQTTVQTDRLSGAAGSNQTLDTGAQALSLSRLDSGKTLADSSALGAGWTLTGASVALDTAVALRSGSLSVEATSGDLTLGTHADIDVSGREVTFFNVTKPTWGGDVRLTATTGSVVLAAAEADGEQTQAAATGKARINVSGAAGADGGTLTASAVNGDVDLSGATLVGQTTADADGNLGAGARVRVDAQNVSDFSAFNTALNDGGFSGERTVRTRSADGLTVAATDVVRADTVNLTADGGALVVEGRVSASGSDGGSVALYGQSVTLTGTAHVEARADTEGGQGGRVEIGAATQVSEAAAGHIDLQEGSTIDVSGGGGGTVHLRAQRQGTGVAVTALDSTITGASEVNLEAVRVYNKTGNVALNVSTTNNNTTLGLTGINNDNTSYATNYTAIETSLGQADNAAFHILSGVEVRAGGNITLGNDWNLVNSAAGGEAGVLTLRAGGNLAINNNLSDGFVNATAAYPSGSTPLQDSAVRGGRSWGYNLVAGADASSANVLATRTILAGEETGDITVAAGKLVRTGTGDIRMAAGRDITLRSATSVVYTAGTASPALSGVTAPATAQRAYFTQGGGDVSMTAARDIVASVASSQLWTDWLYRQGRLNAQGTAYDATAQGQLAWWVRFDRFAQGVGALGGGNVRISAGHDVSNLSASAPTQGRMASVTPSAGSLVRTGGGDVTVEAGNDILSGQYFADNGDVKLVAGHAVSSGREVSEQPVYTQLALGDGSATVRATRDVNIGAVVNPTLVVQDNGGSDGNNTGTTTTRKQRESLFSTYGEDSGVSLNSLLGDAVLHENLLAAASAYTVLGSSVYTANKDYDFPLSYLPPTLALTAFTGDVAVNGAATLMPSNQGQLELLAQGSVDLKGQITLSDADPATVAGTTRPTNNPLLVLGPTHAANPVHAGDVSTAKVYAVNGDVGWSGGAGSIAIDTSKALEVRAGRDVADFSVAIQHANADDRSVVQAGRDVTFTPGISRSELTGIRVGGLGTLEVTAGRDVNLGTSGGILSRGDLDNNNLPVGGAAIQVMAGVGASGLDAAAALQRLADRVSAGPVSDTDLWLVRWLSGNDSLSAAEAPAAVAVVQAQDGQTQSNEVRNMLFTALRETGRAANVADSGYAGSFDRGYAAMELVFPGISAQDANGNFTGYEGSINLFASRINTARGGDISFLVPGGGLVVGLANTPAVLTTLDPADSPGPLGVVASSTGSISGATRDDMLVNQSRILTVGGGDILLWSSEGDLDAGKGKKTATTVPPPVIRVDSSGKVTQELQGAASGSGIGALSSGGVTAGDVDLIAPKGTVNAGDAGIRAGNLNIAAQVVLGADNISVSGTSTGTPVADTSAVTAASSGATTGGDDTGSVVESLNQAAADSAKAAQELAESLRPYVVRVDVLGYGN